MWMLYYLGTQERATKYRGVEQMVARRAHNPEVAGSSPVPATNKSHAFAWLFPFACFVAGTSLAASPREFFFSGGRKLPDKKTHIFSWQGSGATQAKKQNIKKTNDTMLIIKRPISSALVFCTLGRNGALVFSAAFRRRLFHLYLFFHSNASPGFFIFPCFLQGSAGGQSGARTPCQQSLLWEYHPRFRPPDAPKNKWKNDGMTGKNKCPKPPKKQAPALLVKLRRSAGNRPGPIPFGLLTSHTAPCPPFP